MTTDRLLEILAERGLSLAWGDDGRPTLRGPAEEATPALKEVVVIHRDELVRRLPPRPPQARRVVLLAAGGKDAPPEAVPWEGPAGAEYAALRREAAAHPGRAVAAEHLRPACRSRPAAEWVRFLWSGVTEVGNGRSEDARP